LPEQIARARKRVEEAFKRGEEASERAKEVAERAKKQAFNPWDGSHKQLVESVKNQMNDPDSFKHAKTLTYVLGKKTVVQMEFRGKNAFGGVITETALATVDSDWHIVEWVLVDGKM